MKKHCFKGLSGAKGDLNRKNAPVLTHITQLYLAVLFSLFPILPCIGGYETIAEQAYLWFLILSIGYLAALILVALELVLVGKCTARFLLAPLLEHSACKLFLLLFLGWSILSAIFSPISGTWIGLGQYGGLLTTLIYCLLFLAVSSYGQWDFRFLALLGGVIVLNTIIGLLQYAGLNPLNLYPDGTNFHDAYVRYNGSFLGTLGNVDILSAFLCLIVPIFYASFLLTGKKLALLPMGAGVLLFVLADVDSGYLGLTATLLLTLPFLFCRRAAWPRGCLAFSILLLCTGSGTLLYADHETALRVQCTPLSAGLLSAGLLLFVIWLLCRRQEGSSNCSSKMVKKLGIAVLILCCTALVAVYALPFSSGAISELHQILHGNLDPNFGSGRLRIWKETLHLIAEAPFLGGGPDTLVARMPFTFTRYAPELGTTIEAAIDTAHNDFLNIAVNQGLPALGFYLAMLANLLWRCLKRLEQPPILFLLPGILAYLVQSCFTFSFCSVTSLFWVLLALCERTINQSRGGN